MYLEHFKLSKPPFSLTPNTEFYCELPTHQEALNVLLLSLQHGEGFIKILGEVGTGKTLLCRLLLNALDADFVTAYIPNPDQNADSLRLSLATELGLKPEKDLPQHQLLDAINLRLLELHKAGKKTVLLIDEAQALPEMCLEAIRLLTNLETEEKKLLQVVLFGQPELETKLDKPSLRQLKQRITFSYTLKPLAKHELDVYLYHRLAKAGYTYGSLFSAGAKKQLFRASGGLPRLLNILCHKSMLVSYGRGANTVDVAAVKRAVADTESAQSTKKHRLNSNIMLTVVSGLALSLVLIVYWKLGLL
ncbi:ExeA family protein [Legionella yabuuchiae]|uniref:ExeA family protein n=1 Tax=Legionella yabuuchiae TaxID=376727 RepID=UPI001054D33A|nr:AAA family ATPase [Legionella yabuuchiae]